MQIPTLDFEAIKASMAQMEVEIIRLRATGLAMPRSKINAPPPPPQP